MDPASINIQPIKSKNCIRHFNCGEQSIDKWAKEKAFKHNSKDKARVFIARNDSATTAVGFYSLSFTSHTSDKLTGHERGLYGKSGIVPFIYIDWLAVQRSLQGGGCGTFLLIDALRRAFWVSDHVAFYGVALRSLNERTTAFYQKNGFKAPHPEETYPLMILPVWTIRELFNSAR